MSVPRVMAETSIPLVVVEMSVALAVVETDRPRSAPGIFWKLATERMTEAHNGLMSRDNQIYAIISASLCKRKMVRLLRFRHRFPLPHFSDDGTPLLRMGLHAASRTMRDVSTGGA
ncbi:hypothetical protein ACLOJK_024893 [Asimina triloba]